MLWLLQTLSLQSGHLAVPYFLVEAPIPPDNERVDVPSPLITSTCRPLNLVEFFARPAVMGLSVQIAPFLSAQPALEMADVDNVDLNDREMEKRVIRKQDMHLLPWMCITYLLCQSCSG